MKTDIEIAQSIELQPIVDVVKIIGLVDDDLELYGKYKAKLSFDKIREVEKNTVGKLILVTAINPTPAGEGKSTITIGLADALNKIGKKTMIAIREPSLGPVMGIKGGAAGGGYAQVLPMEDINLHFTGDMHAITTANNALSALISNKTLAQVMEATRLPNLRKRAGGSPRKGGAHGSARVRHTLADPESACI